MKNVKDQVYALIATRPKIRTVEIADIIDCEVEHVQPGLANEIARGDIVVHEVTAPNGRPANGFEFSEAFKRTSAYHEIMAAAGVEHVPTPSAPSETAPTPAPAVETPPALTGSYPERAVAYIERCGGRADNEALRIAIGLGHGTAPTSYLHSAISSGRLARDGRDWILGPNATRPARYAPGKTKARAIPVVKPVAAPAVEAVTAAPPPAAFRVGHWSDGVLELQRAGQTIAVLSAAEQADVKVFLSSRT